MMKSKRKGSPTKGVYLLILLLNTITYIIAQPSNDICDNAQVLSIGQCMLVSAVGATASGNPTQYLSCGDRSNQVVDVWFEVIVPTSGNITIETNAVPNGIESVEMEAYTGSCSVLQSVACNIAKERYTSLDNHARISLEGRPPGEALFYRVFGYGESWEFEICALDQGYIHPCKIELIEVLGQSACDSASNTFSQELKVHYREDGNVDVLDINLNEFSLTTSPQVVTLNNLPANSFEFDIHAGLVNYDSYGSCQSNGSYFVSQAISAPNCYNGQVFNDECINAFQLEVSEYCNSETFSQLGATRSMISGLNNNYDFVFAPQDVWFSFIMPSNGEAIVKVFDQDIDAISAIYTGSCNSLSILAGSIYNSESVRVQHVAGETIYVRVADINGDNQGEFRICVIAPELFTNDVCTNAIEISTGNYCKGNTYSDHFATSGLFPSPALSCSEDDNLTKDQWFKVTVPANGGLLVRTVNREASYSLFNIEVFEGGCASLSSLGCDLSAISFDDRTPGEVLYLRVIGADWRDSGYAFAVCALSPKNDSCDSFIPLNIDLICNPDTIDINLFTASIYPDSTFMCNPNSSSVADAWYEISVPDEQEYIIRTVSINDRYVGSSLELYEGSCGAFTSIACDQRSLNNDNSQLSFKNHIVGEKLYLRVGANSNSERLIGVCITPVAVNNACQGALPLVVDGDCMILTNEVSTASLEPSPSLSCGDWSTPAKDLWIQIEVPQSGNLTIETNKVIGGTEGTRMELFSGSCGTLTSVVCNDNKERFNNYNPFARIALEGRTSGELLYIRVESEGNLGEFEICATSHGYIHPCKIELIELISQSPCDSATNTFTQNLLVHYRTDGSPDQLNINSQNFDITGSPQLIALNGLVANQNIVSIYADFNVENDYTSCEANSRYDAYDIIEPPSNCFNGELINDECSSAIPLDVLSYCQNAVFSQLGATFNPEITGYHCYFSEFPMDVWFSFIVPISGEAIVNTYEVEIFTTFTLYMGKCESLIPFESCGDASESIRITHSPGDTVYVRVENPNPFQQGEFGICIMEPESMTNDICANAIEIPIASSCIGGIYSDHIASAEYAPTPSLSCGSGEEAEDVWFKVMVPTGGDLNIQYENIERELSNFNSVVMEVYSGSCGSLSLIDCTRFGTINLMNRISGEEIFIRVDGRFRRKSTFRICASAYCPNITSFSNNITSDTDLRVSDEINTSSVVSESSKLLLDAVNQTILLPSFEVEKQAQLEIYTSGCQE